MSDFKDAIEPVKVSISQLEELIGRDDLEVEIMPDGTVRAKRIPAPEKPLTLRENVGGEYGPSRYANADLLRAIILSPLKYLQRCSS